MVAAIQNKGFYNLKYTKCYTTNVGSIDKFQIKIFKSVATLPKLGY
jgi:hypothetical protein